MKTRVSYFLLRGDNEALAIGELKALLDVYDCRPRRLQCYTMVCIVHHECNSIEEKIVGRAGFIKEAGILVALDNPYNPSLNVNNAIEKGARVHASILKKGVEEDEARKYTSYLAERYGLKIEGGRGRLRVLFTDGIAIIGVKTAEQDTRGLYERSKLKPYKRSISLTPEISRLLVNLARAREGMVLLDPFAGTGSILVEAGLMGIRAIGVEIDADIARGMEENLRFYNINAIPVVGDSSEIEATVVDAIATDPPYGRGASTHGYSQAVLLKKFIEKAWTTLRSGGYMSFMTPLHLEDLVDEVLCKSEFMSIARYYQYVHGGLTRVIYVVEKIEY
ncbi:MAG: TRM11 family methyltransferase [Desulfurococcus sp.]|nr:TRM11 family methyltransferase [Desulfurococcus sp.]